MKSSVLRPDDFKVGMFVTVKDLIKTVSEFDENDTHDPMQFMRMMHNQESAASERHLEILKGSVIRIDAINLPFIIRATPITIKRWGR